MSTFREDHKISSRKHFFLQKCTFLQLSNRNCEWHLNIKFYWCHYRISPNPMTVVLKIYMDRQTIIWLMSQNKEVWSLLLWRVHQYDKYNWRRGKKWDQNIQKKSDQILQCALLGIPKTFCLILIGYQNISNDLRFMKVQVFNFDKTHGHFKYKCPSVRS